MKKQIRISDSHFNELESLSADLGLQRAEILGIAIGFLRALRSNKAKSIKVFTSDGKEVEMVLPVDMS